jgi:hypothetical protein
MIAPVCEHVFCASCIWLGTKRLSTCPICREPVFANNGFKPAPRIIQNMIANLKIRCEFQESGCESVVTTKQLKSHLEQCDFRPVYCPYEGCPFDENAELHLCAKDLKDHCSTCEYGNKFCPTCAQQVLIAEFDAHMETGCPKLAVPCHFPGCAFVGEKGDEQMWKTHHTEAMQDHAFLMLAAIGRQGKMLQEIQQKIKSSEDHRISARRDVVFKTSIPVSSLRVGDKVVRTPGTLKDNNADERPDRVGIVRELANGWVTVEWFSNWYLSDEKPDVSESGSYKTRCRMGADGEFDLRLCLDDTVVSYVVDYLLKERQRIVVSVGDRVVRSDAWRYGDQVSVQTHFRHSSFFRGVGCGEFVAMHWLDKFVSVFHFSHPLFGISGWHRISPTRYRCEQA